MNEQTTTATVASWQQWSVWLARTGYSDLEHSTVMTLQQINAAKIGTAQPTPVKIYLAALEVERSWEREAAEDAPQLLALAAD